MIARHHQISNAFILLQSEATPQADTGRTTERPSGAALARFSARGVTPAPHVQAASWAHTTKRTFKAPHVQTVTIKLTINRQQKPGEPLNDPAARPLRAFLQGACRQLPQNQTAPLSRHDHPAFLRGCVAYNTNAHPCPITWNCIPGFSPTIQSCPVSRLSTTIINHQLQQHSRYSVSFSHFFTIFMLIFHSFYAISTSFHIKNGSFPLIQNYTGALLASLHQLPIFSIIIRHLRSHRPSSSKPLGHKEHSSMHKLFVFLYPAF